MSEPGMPPLSTIERTLVSTVLAFTADGTDAEMRALRTGIEALLRAAPSGSVEELLNRLNSTGAEFAYYPPNALVRKIHFLIGDVVLKNEGGLEGSEHLDGLEGRPLVFLQNHLSYSDANVLSVLLDRAGRGSFADRLTVIAGPKVYSDPMRRFSSLCFGTIKTPQSTDLASGEAVMPLREVARLAREAIAHATERQEAGDALLVFVEGTRTRTGGMQRALAAVARYLENESVVLVPVGITGSENLVPMDDQRVHRATVGVRIGRSATVAELSGAAKGNRRLMMDAIGLAIAQALPPAYRGEYANEEAELDDARRVAHVVFGV